MANEGRLRPDFKKMEMEGIAVLNDGLPALPQVLIHSTPIPLACWKNGACGAVMFFFYFQNEERVICSSNITLRYNREDAGWRPDNKGFFYGELRPESPGWIDPIGSPESLEYAEYYALNASGSMYNSEPDAGRAAIVVSGRHSPDVSEIWLIQEGTTQRRDADGHFGFWTICTDRYAPYRIEAHEASGRLVGYIDGDLDNPVP